MTTTKTTKISKTLDRALGLAAEYRRRVERGDAVLAEQTRRTIEDLVGKPMRSGEIRFPASVAAAMAPTLVIVGLRGGDASDARSAVAVDLDPGDVRPVEWLALVRADLVAQLVEETGAEVVDAGEAGPWDGSSFGDGAGTVQRVNGRLVGSGAYAHLSGEAAS